MEQTINNNNPKSLSDKRILKKIASAIGLALIVYFFVQQLAASLFEFSAACTATLGVRYFANIVRPILAFLSSNAGNWFLNLIIGTTAGLTSIFFLSKILGFRLKALFQPSYQGASYTIKGTVLFLDANLISSAVTTIFLAIFTSVFGVTPSSPDFSVSYQQPSAVVFYLLYAAVAAPIVEEILFRGLILRSLQNFGNIFAIIVSSLLFGLWHGNFEQAIPILCSSVLFGIIAIRSNSIVPSIIAHSLNNIIIAAFSFADTSLSASLAQTLNFGAFFFLLLAGALILAFSLSSLKISDFNRSSLSYQQRFASVCSTPAVIALLFVFVLQFGMTLLPQ